ncbi:MAG: TrmB family transcriptional regulator [Candidatus Odinarchaeota archaeon]
MSISKTSKSGPSRKISDEQHLNLLMTCGLTNPQARVYLELVKKRETTASDLCKTTGVRASRIYGILSELEEMGLVIVQTSTPKLYITVPLTEGIQKLQERLDSDYDRKKNAIKELNLQLTHLYDSADSIPSAIAYIIKGRKNIINKIHYELLGAEKDILFRFPNPDLYFEFEPVLLELQEKGIAINAGLCHVQIGKLREDTKRFPELPLTVCKTCCDCFYLMIDYDYLLSVSNWSSADVYAIWTSDTSLVNMTTFYSDSNVK